METTVDRANSSSTASNAIVSAGEHSVVFVQKRDRSVLKTTAPDCGSESKTGIRDR